jgi:hypothetical protein
MPASWIRDLLLMSRCCCLDHRQVCIFIAIAPHQLMACTHQVLLLLLLQTMMCCAAEEHIP